MSHPIVETKGRCEVVDADVLVDGGHRSCHFARIDWSADLSHIDRCAGYSQQ